MVAIQVELMQVCLPTEAAQLLHLEQRLTYRALHQLQRLQLIMQRLLQATARP
jgi:hypothetical protein